MLKLLENMKLFVSTNYFIQKKIVSDHEIYPLSFSSNRFMGKLLSNTLHSRKKSPNKETFLETILDIRNPKMFFRLGEFSFRFCVKLIHGKLFKINS